MSERIPATFSRRNFLKLDFGDGGNNPQQQGTGEAQLTEAMRVACSNNGGSWTAERTGITLDIEIKTDSDGVVFAEATGPTGLIKSETCANLTGQVDSIPTTHPTVAAIPEDINVPANTNTISPEIATRAPFPKETRNGVLLLAGGGLSWIIGRRILLGLQSRIESTEQEQPVVTTRSGPHAGAGNGGYGGYPPGRFVDPSIAAQNAEMEKQRRERAQRAKDIVVTTRSGPHAGAGNGGYGGYPPGRFVDPSIAAQNAEMEKQRREHAQRAKDIADGIEQEIKYQIEDAVRADQNYARNVASSSMGNWFLSIISWIYDKGE